MNKSLRDVIEMHSEISNDPWVSSRLDARRRDASLTYLNEERKKSLINDWHSKDNNTRMDRLLLLQSQECGMLKNLQEQKYNEMTRRNNESMENKMGKILEIEKNASLHKDRYSQYLRENDPILRKLATQLREAYVNKIRLAQIDEKERNKNDIAVADLPYVRALEERIKEDEEKEKLELFQEEERKYKLRRLLKQQIEEKEENIELKMDKEEDKIRIEAIIKANIEEMALEKAQEFEKKMSLRKCFHDFMDEKEKELKRQKQFLLEEENKLKKYAQFSDSRKDEQLRLKKLKEEYLDSVQKRLGELINKKQKDIIEFEEARQDVAIAQAELHAFRFEQDEKEAKEKAKRQYVAELDKCKESSKAAELENKMRDLNLDREIEKVNQMKTDLEKERQMQKKLKNDKFRDDCQADIGYKNLEKIRCLEEERERDRLYTEDNEKYDGDVQRERIKMIKEMAPHLYPGCIPRGMLKEDDVQYLEEPLKNFLLNKKSYPDSDLF